MKKFTISAIAAFAVIVSLLSFPMVSAQAQTVDCSAASGAFTGPDGGFANSGGRVAIDAMPIANWTQPEGCEGFNFDAWITNNIKDEGSNAIHETAVIWLQCGSWVSEKRQIESAAQAGGNLTEDASYGVHISIPINSGTCGIFLSTQDGYSSKFSWKVVGTPVPAPTTTVPATTTPPEPTVVPTTTPAPTTSVVTSRPPMSQPPVAVNTGYLETEEDEPVSDNVRDEGPNYVRALVGVGVLALFFFGSLAFLLRANKKAKPTN